jgi:hypothetical protein
VSRTSEGTAVRRSELRRVAGSFGIVAVLVFLAWGSWFAWGSELEFAGARDARPIGEDGRMPADPLVMVDMGGVHENYQPVRTFAGVRTVDFLTDDELDVYEKAGSAAARMAVSVFREGKATLVVVQVRDAAAAREAAAELEELQADYGLEPADRHVRFAKDGSLTRSVYSHKDLVVRLEVRGKTRDWVRTRTSEIMTAQLEVLPADE